ncbi:hypothetical protein B0H19DRAFT_1272996 [Mycena capillaripes]|nr:hypothetical protein B0H19DRAFT_1272996 [Mycena capillaripes]
MMKSVLLAAAFALGAAAQQLTINTPPNSIAAQCEPLLIQWSGGTPPYFVSLILNIKDNTGLPAQSAAFTVTTGTGDSCVGAASPGGGSSDSSAGGTGPTSAGGSTSGSAAPTAKQSGSTSGSSSAPSKTPSAAQAVGVPTGVFPAFAAVLGAGLIAVLA